MTRIFYDTEFTKFGSDSELISIGCISSDSRDFYGEVSDVNMKDATLWVWQTVVKLLSGKNRVPFQNLAKQFQRYLVSFETENVTIISDYYLDEVFAKSLNVGGREIEFCSVAGLINRVLPAEYNTLKNRNELDEIFVNAKRQFFANYLNENKHNALSDAKALRYGFAALAAECLKKYEVVL